MSLSINQNKTTLLVISSCGLGLGLLAGYCYRRTLNKNGKHFKLPPVKIINNNHEWNLHSKSFLEFCYTSKVLGVDCEWVTNDKKRKPVALLQVANAQDVCFLIRLNQFEGNFPSSLKSLLENKSIFKLGVAIHDDAKKLQQDYNLKVQNYLDIRFIVDKVSKFKHLERKSLKNLAKLTLGVDLEEHWKIRCSNWEDSTLSEKQIKYAASDAVAAALIFRELMRLRMEQWWHWHSPTDQEMYEAVFKDHHLDIDRIYHQAKLNKSPDYQKLYDKGFQKKVGTRAYSTRSKPLYHNCQLQAPDGEPLCTCDVRKARWYLYRGLGTLITENPLTVRLNFEPSGRPILDNKYYIQEKENKCVVCGLSDSVIRKTVVPHEYRRFFPLLMKNHLSHDVLLLCINCHITSNAYDAVMRQQLANECDAPIGRLDDIKCREDPDIKRVKSAGRALRKSGSKLPVERKLELENILMSYYRVTELDEETIEMASNSEAVYQNDTYLPHGQKVVQYQCQNGGLIAFEIRWRQHFLDTMQPMFLPTMWSVDHNHERLALQVTKNPKTDFDLSILGLPQS